MNSVQYIDDGKFVVAEEWASWGLVAGSEHERC